MKISVLLLYHRKTSAPRLSYVMSSKLLDPSALLSNSTIKQGQVYKGLGVVPRTDHTLNKW